MRVRQTSYASQPDATLSFERRAANSSFAAFAGRGKVVSASTRVFMILGNLRASLLFSPASLSDERGFIASDVSKASEINVLGICKSVNL